MVLSHAPHAEDVSASYVPEEKQRLGKTTAFKLWFASPLGVRVLFKWKVMRNSGTFVPLGPCHV